MEKQDQTQSSKENKQKNNAGCGLIIAIIFIVFVFSKMCSSNDNGNSNNTESYALIVSRGFVENQLKAPSTAEFGDSTENVRKVNDSTFEVSSYVDSQNSFGAQLRSNYRCRIIFLKNDQVRCEDLVIE